MERALNCLLFIASALALVIAGLVIWGMFFERPYLTYQNLPFPPELQRVKPGQVMPLTVIRCSSASTIKSYLITHELERLDVATPNVLMKSEPTSIKPGCHQSTSLINLVPIATPPGTYRVVGVAVVDGLFHTFPVPWHSQSFEVAP